jgi:simple sugar transport system ATP-binding protein
MASSQRHEAAGPAPANGSRPAVEAVDITKRYGPTTALNNVTLTVADGDAHALVGRNGAGKSTLVSIITGLQEADAGNVLFRGLPAPSIANRDAWRRLVACVYQKSTIIRSLSVAENLFLNRQHRAGPVISWSAMRKQAQEMVDEWDIDVDVQGNAGELTVEQREMVEIARALSFGARFIVLDEPTAQLDGRGVTRLFDRLRAVQATGVSFLYISHHIEEIFEICQTVTVFRDARHIMTNRVADISTTDLVSAMTGDAEILNTTERRTVKRAGAPVLEVDALSHVGTFRDVSFDVAPGEVVAITGSGSSGRIALAETIVGLRKATSGTLKVNGVTPRAGSVASALSAGIGFVPRDRHHEGLVEGLSLAENLTMTVTRQLGRAGFIDPRQRDARAKRAIHDLSIVASGPEQVAGSLSGGNQQKVVMGRALANDPKLLVLMHPTAGVDVRSKATLIEVIDRVREAGTAVLIVSDELEDLRPADRVLVMLHGEVVTELAKGWQDSDVVAATEGIGRADE